MINVKTTVNVKNERTSELHRRINLYRIMCDIKGLRKNMKDPLDLLLYVTLIPMKFKIILSILLYVSTQFSTALCLTIYHLLSTFDKRELLKHGSFGGIEIFVLINLWTVLVKHKEIMNFVDTFKQIIIPVTVEVVGERNYKHIMLQVLIIKVIVIVNYTLAITAAFGFTLSPEYFNKKTYLAVWIREHFPEYSEKILFCIHLSNFPVAIVLAALSIAVSYCALTGMYQILVMNEFVKAICATSIPPDQRYNSDIYQAIVCQRLKICIMYHTLTIRVMEIGSKIINMPTILFSVGGVILGGSLVLEFFTNDPSQMSNQYFGIVCFALSGAISSSLYVTSGQLVKNMSEQTHYILTQLPWYYMNRNNLIIYTVFLRKTETPLTLSCQLVEINFLLLVRILKAIYSMAALLGQLVSSTSLGGADLEKY